MRLKERSELEALCDYLRKNAEDFVLRWQWLYGFLSTIDFFVAASGMVVLGLFARLDTETKKKLSKHTIRIVICIVLQSIFKATSNLLILDEAVSSLRNYNPFDCRNDVLLSKFSVAFVVDLFAIMFNLIFKVLVLHSLVFLSSLQKLEANLRARAILLFQSVTSLLGVAFCVRFCATIAFYVISGKSRNSCESLQVDRSEIIMTSTSAAQDISVGVGFIIELVYSMRMFQNTEYATRNLGESSNAFGEFASRQLVTLNFIKKRVLLMILFFIFASVASAAINILQTKWLIDDAAFNFDSRPNCTMATYVEEIPEPTFVQDFLDSTGCCVIVLCSLVSLNWTHLFDGPVNRNTDSQPIDRFIFAED